MVRPRGFIFLALAFVWSIVALRIVTEFRRADSPLRHDDLETRVAEQRLFYEGIYPHSAVTVPPRGVNDVNSDYPPHSFVLAIPWIPPALQGWATKGWYTFCQIVAAGVLINFGWRSGREVDVRLAWLQAGAIAGMTGLWADILFGNYSALVCALLVAMYELQARNRPLAAGWAWSAAMLKPQVGALFCTLFLGRRDWRGFAAGGGFLIAATGLACAWTGVTPWRALSGVYLSRLLDISIETNSLVAVAWNFGVPTSIAQPVLALLGAGVIIVVLHTRLRQADGLARFAAVALTGRLCIYHRTSDDLMLVFAIAYFGRQAWRNRSLTDWVAAAVLGVSVWVPTKWWAESTLVAILIVAVWAGLLWKLICDNKSDLISNGVVLLESNSASIRGDA